MRRKPLWVVVGYWGRDKEYAGDLQVHGPFALRRDALTFKRWATHEDWEWTITPLYSVDPDQVGVKTVI